MTALCVDSGLDFLATSRGTIMERTGKRWDAPIRFSEQLAMCRRCEMREECLAIAIRNDEPRGIWGGTFPHERTEMVAAPPIDWVALREGRTP